MVLATTCGSQFFSQIFTDSRLNKITYLLFILKSKQNGIFQGIFLTETLQDFFDNRKLVMQDYQKSRKFSVLPWYPYNSKYIVKKLLQAVQEKLCSSHFTAIPPSRLHRCKLSTQCECTVTPFFVQQIAAEWWRGRGGKLKRILGKNTIFKEHPAVYSIANFQLLTIHILQMRP